MAYNPDIVEISSLYGVWFYICTNGEVVRDRISGLSIENDDDKTTEAIRAGIHSIRRAGFDYQQVPSFRAYNGGPRKALVEPVYFVRDALDDGKYGEWKREMMTSEIPPEIRAAAETIAGEAIDAMQPETAVMSDL